MSIGSAGGYLLVGSLPFTCHGSAYQSITIGYCYGYATVFATSGSTGTGMTAVYLYNTGRRNQSESIYPNNLGTGGTNLYMSVTYKTT
jgi:predicted membrane protein